MSFATTRKAEASAMASQEEAGHVDARCEWWGLEVSPAIAAARCLTPLRVRLHEPPVRRARSAVPDALHWKCTLSGRDKTPQQGVTLSRSALRIAGDGHVEGAGGGGSNPTNVPCHRRARARGDRHSSPKESGRAPPARGLASPNPGRGAALDAPNHSSLTPADA